MAKFTRRNFITTGSAAFLSTTVSHRWAAIPSNINLYDSNGDAPEITEAKLGFIPVTSACPLIVAKAKGFFAKYGMLNVEVLKQPSWAVMRDKLMLGSANEGLDGGHLLFPMVYLMATGDISYGRKVPMYILARLNVNGQGVSVTNAYQDLQLRLDSSPLKSVFAKKRLVEENVRCAIPYRRVTGDFFMRWWLAYGGIDPDQDVSLIVVPPPQMVANMQGGSMDAFCVVDPWHHRLIKQGIGYSTVTSGELWNNHPEKALGVRAEWVDKHPKAAKALLAAVLEAQIWCDQPENKAELFQILSQRQWVGVRSEFLRDRLLGKFDYGNGRVVENSPHAIKFWRENASYPYKSHDLWFFIEDMRWGNRSQEFDPQPIINAVNREDLWREAAKFIGQEKAIPASTSRGVEKFFNGLEFDPQNPQAYFNAPKLQNI
ncbi:ABC transporter substrate-binding protein [Nostocaceae cyanobacterium CENA357]|uniref:ABC transporter substrate-binding protein n=1 Tax=Atlanticothrix silvestris CENA357 TaxID=1725252 RepID=A0A8J7L5K0_9CYAN|nr:CmpA/NrtA family ABC transporter substrate-binding protein [Atlanticothrix silvestris]MBH8556104.1 ABC transporter substrate-binding protein [Atlanticothrix silvestris CENA357]